VTSPSARAYVRRNCRWGYPGFRTPVLPRSWPSGPKTEPAQASELLQWCAGLTANGARAFALRATADRQNSAGRPPCRWDAVQLLDHMCSVPWGRGWAAAACEQYRVLRPGTRPWVSTAEYVFSGGRRHFDASCAGLLQAGRPTVHHGGTARAPQRPPRSPCPRACSTRRWWQPAFDHATGIPRISGRLAHRRRMGPHSSRCPRRAQQHAAMA
jgi:hypothetical protein